MKKLLFMLPMLCASLFAMTEEPFHFEAKVKYLRYNHEDHNSLQLSAEKKWENDFAWADAKVKANLNDVEWNDRVVGIQLDKCLIGAKSVSCRGIEFFAEAGRAKLDSIFNSKMQFNSHFNGVHAGIKIGDVTIHASKHILSTEYNAYGTTAEVIYRNVVNLPVDLSYSINEHLSAGPYVISQASAFYKGYEMLNNPVTLYGAILVNHKYSNDITGVYTGAIIGNLNGPKDWQLDISYFYDNAYCVPFFDYQGLCGRGFQFKGTTLITDNLSIESKLIFSDYDRIEIAAAYRW